MMIVEIQKVYARFHNDKRFYILAVCTCIYMNMNMLYYIIFPSYVASSCSLSEEHFGFLAEFGEKKSCLAKANDHIYIVQSNTFIRILYSILYARDI